MQTVSNGKEKQSVYKKECSRYNKALKEEFYLEAVVISYAILEDRLVSFLHHAGIVSRNHEDLKVNDAVKPYMRKILKKDDNYSFHIKDISKKLELITALLNMSEETACEIDTSLNEYWLGLPKKGKVAKPGYMHDLFLQIEKTDRNSVRSTLAKIEPWKAERNQLIHALLNKAVTSANDAKKKCAEEGGIIWRDVDKYLVRPFRNNPIRRKYKIQ